MSHGCCSCMRMTSSVATLQQRSNRRASLAKKGNSCSNCERLHAKYRVLQIFECEVVVFVKIETRVKAATKTDFIVSFSVYQDSLKLDKCNQINPIKPSTFWTVQDPGGEGRSAPSFFLSSWRESLAQNGLKIKFPQNLQIMSQFKYLTPLVREI